MRVINGGQLGMDEKVVEDANLSDLLEKRLRLYDDKGEVTKAYKEADRGVKAVIETLGMADGDALRVGHFRITRTAIPPRSVEFETGATSRVRITLFGDDA